MSLDLKTIEALASDQPSLKAASKLMKSSKWPGRFKNAENSIVWGECQGSGSNPYRVIFDCEEHGYKCTCPSRKFPCKHVIALMWMFVETEPDFNTAEIPDWVREWQGRRKRGKSPTQPSETKSAHKDLTGALAQELENTTAPDPKEIERREKAAKTRAEQSHRLILSGLSELEGWINDQLRLGLVNFLKESRERCRRIAARLVDSRAPSLAGRLDELPAMLVGLKSNEAVDATLMEFSRLLILSRSYQTDPQRLDVKAAISTAISREELLARTDLQTKEGHWEVFAVQTLTQRDGLVRQSTWLRLLEAEQNVFALLLDHYPAATGQRGTSFTPGEQISATLAFYPGELLLRAVIVERHADRVPESVSVEWKNAGSENPLQDYRQQFVKAPWSHELPLTLGAGRLVETDSGQYWWRLENHKTALPLVEAPPAYLIGTRLQRSLALWNGQRATLLATQTKRGITYFT